jgi:hypothetical protein
MLTKMRLPFRTSSNLAFIIQSMLLITLLSVLLPLPLNSRAASNPPRHSRR